ncbi:hypothetical protein BJX70DRAFT_392068 [Aspergillus crustosus]
MSAMTGPRSPTSPWPQESQTVALPSSSNPAIFFDPPPSLNKSANQELPGSNYFSFSVESPSNYNRNRDHLSNAHPDESPEGQLLSRKDVADQQAGSFRKRTGEFDPAIYRLSLNRAWERDGPIVSTHTAETNGTPLSTESCAELLGSYANDTVLLDVRPYAHFSRGSIKGSLNLCIPTTLLKRPSFDTKKLAATFTDEGDRTSFARWKQCRYIIVYDTGTSNMKDAAPLTSVLKKFRVEGWTGEGLILMGGFKIFSIKFPELTRQQQQQPPGTRSKKGSPMQIDLSQSAPIAGGCNIPESSNAAIPFFGNIRQNMDLVGGVGQIALRQQLTDTQRRTLPPWLREVSDPTDQGRIAASRFFDIEKAELERMKQALSYDQNNDLAGLSSGRFRVAGIEKGTKNRYNDIYPYDHSRVRLHGVPHGGCDYVNASYMKAEYSDRYYIATQAPVPDTFVDFWRVVWEQDVRLIVSLTAETERGQVKCHPYWKSGSYGPFNLNNFSKKYIPLHVESDKPSTDSATIVVRHFNCLFVLLKERAFKQLYTSNSAANCVRFQIPSVKASSLTDKGRIIICRGQRSVQILQVRKGQIVPIARVRIPLVQKGSVEILKTAFHGPDSIYILHRFVAEHVDSSRPSGMVYLTCHSLQSPEGPVRITAFPEQTEGSPSALAIGTDQTFLITWCHRIHSNHTAILYTVKKDSEYDVEPNLVGFFYASRHLQRWIGNTRGALITKAAFNDRATQVLYHYQAKSLYASFQKIDHSETPILYENEIPVQFTDNLSLLFAIDKPFFGTHASDGFSVCRWRYLSLGIATHREENWTVACLLRSEATCRHNDCLHTLDLDRGRRLANWVVVARLWGFRDAADSLGCTVATSPNGTRIAVANWKIIYVWALEPEALIDRDLKGYYHPSWTSSTTGQIEIHPIVLHPDAVCFQLCFTAGENEIIAMTDRGIMVWDLAPTGRGTRICRELPT